MHVCVSKQIIIGSHNGWPVQSHYLNQCWNLVSGTIRNTLQLNRNRISYIISFKKMHLKQSSGKWRPFCLGLNVLTLQLYPVYINVYHGSKEISFFCRLIIFCYLLCPLVPHCDTESMCQLNSKEEHLIVQKNRIILKMNGLLNIFGSFVQVELGTYSKKWHSYHNNFSYRQWHMQLALSSMTLYMHIINSLRPSDAYMCR